MIDTSKLELEKLILENKVYDLENTLSDTISFFSASLAVTGLGVALFAIFLGYILNKIFDDKLKKIQQQSDEVKTAHSKIEELKKEIKEKLTSIENLEKKLKENEESNKKRDEIINYYTDTVDFLFEKTEFVRLFNNSEKLITDIKELESNIKSVNEYTEATEDLEDFRSCASKELGTYFYELEQGERDESLKELKELYENLLKYRNELKSIKN